jgi:DNA invertase Pin-like site-specific DNA recombinase
VIYARYSSHGQQEQSIDGQLRDCYAYAEREKLLVMGEYIDRALTGRNDDRPDFQRMIADSAKKQFQHIIVYKLDRFARNRFDSAHYKHLLKKNGVKVVSATERISDDPEGIILEGVIESLAEYYSANLSQNVRRGQRESVLKGSHIGGIPPFGFKSVTIDGKHKLIADENNAPIIRYVFEQYANGITKKKIMGNLTAKGVLNYYGRPLTYSAMQHALKNEKYIGKYIYNGQEVAGACEALIDEETFGKVQEMLKARSHGKSGEKSREDYLLQGKAYCGHCGTRLVGDSGANRLGAVYHYYACGKRKKSRECDKKNEKKAFLEWYVVEQTVEYVLQPERMDYIASRIVAKYEDEYNDKRIKEYERQIVKLEREVDNLISAIAASGAKMAERVADKIEVMETQKADIEHELVTMRIANAHRYTREQIIAWLKVFTRGELLDPVFQRRIIDVFINSVYVYDDKIIIYYNVQGGQQVSYMEMLDSSEEPPYGGDPGTCDGAEGAGGVFGYRINQSASLFNILTPRLIFVDGLFGIVIRR